jgi:hypothetical protein
LIFKDQTIQNKWIHQVNCIHTAEVGIELMN